ncbi:hypothetical protein M405DRAFT_823123, partial [Rhizopogon salebrosus TDB-379]
MIYTSRSRSSKGLNHSPGRGTFGHIVGDYDAGHYVFNEDTLDAALGSFTRQDHP